MQVLQGEDEGVVVEFVNPKYKAGSRTDFKKPTRLECMMQDFPKLMSKELGNSAKVWARPAVFFLRVYLIVSPSALYSSDHYY